MKKLLIVVFVLLSFNAQAKDIVFKASGSNMQEQLINLQIQLDELKAKQRETEKKLEKTLLKIEEKK